MNLPAAPIDRTLWSSQGLGGADVRRTFDLARRLKANALVGEGQPLAGKNLAILRASPAQPEDSVFHSAATALGARVAHVWLGDSIGPTGSELQNVPKMLGRLYDAVDCGNVSAIAALQIESQAGIPVYRGLDAHPATVLADLMALCEQLASDSTPKAGASAAPNEAEASMLFIGDATTGRARSFLQGARQLGFDLHFIDATAEALEDAAGSAAAFVVDATDAQHWVLGGPAARIDDAQRSANHRFVLQAVLLITLLAR
ncbi:hypothetical protein BH11PSE13_BH11PSE13_42460 [soil metagenome]